MIAAAPVQANDAVSGRMRLRPARADDAALLLEWRNRPEIVALGSTQRTVSAAEHEAWFAETLRSERRRLFLIELDGVPAGQVRFDFHADGEAEISIFLVAGHTGRGHGPGAIREGCARTFESGGAVRVVAFVRDDNPRSVAAFRKAGFVVDLHGPQRAGHQRLQLVRA